MSRFESLKPRTDRLGRALYPGETQRSDGMYCFRYMDLDGVRRAVYSWRLIEKDPVPEGKQNRKVLREIEKEIRKALEDGIRLHDASVMTVNDIFDLYIENKIEIRDSTRSNYLYMYNRFVRDSFGKMILKKVKYSDVKHFYVSLLKEDKMQPNTLEIIHTMLHPAFALAVRDDYIRKNPSDGIMKDIKKSYLWSGTKRHALTEKEQETFVAYTRSHPKFRHWLPVMTMLLGTGCRVGELVGLRWEDCDFDNNIININHTLTYRKLDGKECGYYISAPKTNAGTRVIPMLSEVRQALLEEHERQSVTGFNTTVIDGYSGFVLQSRLGGVLSAHEINRAIEVITQSYNSEEIRRAEEENRPPELLPHFSAHNLRHTFCTRFCENESNIKIIQEIMGHSDLELSEEDLQIIFEGLMNWRNRLLAEDHPVEPIDDMLVKIMNLI